MASRVRHVFVAAALLLVAAGPLRAQEQPVQAPRLEVLDTDPAPPRGSIGTNTTFTIRYRVDTARPAVVEIEAYDRGQRLSTGNSGMSRIPAGGGTEGSFFFLLSGKRQAVDEVRLVVSDASQPRRRWTFRVPVALTFDPAITGAPPPAPAWVKAWQKKRAAQMNEAVVAGRRDEDRRAAEHPAAALGLGILIGLLVLGLPVASLVLPAWALWRWKGRWRWLAALPVAVVGLKLAAVWVGASRDPSSHNLWPLEIALWEIPALGFLALLWLARRSVLRPSSEGPGA